MPAQRCVQRIPPECGRRVRVSSPNIRRTACRTGVAQAAIALERGERVDEARHVLALAAHVVGQHADAVAAHGPISARYRRLSELDEPILWSYLRLGDLAAARSFAERRGLLKDRATRERLRLAVERPLHVEISGVIELRFTSDALSPLMPGVDIEVQGRPMVARVDTGGSSGESERRAPRCRRPPR